MRVTGSGKSFIATAAVLMACLVIVTILAINIRLQSALTTAPSAPRVKSGSSSAPTLQNTASPLVDIVSPSAPAVGAPDVAPAPASEVSAPSAQSAGAAPGGIVAVSPPKPAPPGTAVPTISASLPPPTPTSPTPSGVTATTTTTAQVSPTPSSDLGDATASTGEAGHHKANGNLTPYVSDSVPGPAPHGKGSHGNKDVHDGDA